MTFIEGCSLPEYFICALATRINLWLLWLCLLYLYLAQSDRFKLSELCQASWLTRLLSKARRFNNWFRLFQFFDNLLGFRVLLSFHWKYNRRFLTISLRLLFVAWSKQQLFYHRVSMLNKWVIDSLIHVSWLLTFLLFFFTILSLTLLWPLRRKIYHFLEIFTLLHLRCLGSSCTIWIFINEFWLESLFKLHCSTLFSLNYATWLYFLFRRQISLVLLWEWKFMSSCSCWTMGIMLLYNARFVRSCFQFMW